jgi:hypothetical protein
LTPVEYWMAAPIVYAMAAEVTAWFYFPLAHGQSTSPGGIFGVSLMAMFVTYPMAFVALGLTQLVRQPRAFVLPIGAIVYVGALGWLGLVYSETRHQDFIWLGIVGPVIALVALGRWWGGRMDVAAAARTNAGPSKSPP